VLRADVVISNADPFRTQRLVGADAFPASFNARLDAWRREGTTLKVNMALRDLPKFRCLPEDRGQLSATIHLLPEGDDIIGQLRESFHTVQAGKLAKRPTIEWYIHTTVDPSLRDPAGHHNSALFVQWVPYQIEGSSWEAELDGYVAHLLSICDEFAPGTSSLVADTFPLTPQGIEAHFGMSWGHIHHIDNSFGFADRCPAKLPIDGLFSCSAGCHPAGSVIGAAGYLAAQAVIAQ
jgi:phytoene dehydrogenase-like protein